MPRGNNGHKESQLMSSRTEWLVFDFGGVLTVPIQQAATELCVDIGLTAEEISQALTAVQMSGQSPLNLLERGEISESEFLKTILGNLPENAASYFDGQTFAEAWFRFLKPDPFTLNLVHHCSKQGIRLALFTNNVKEWRPYWTQLVDTDDFEVIIDSSLEGMRKPERRIFERLRQSVGKNFQELLLIDDSTRNCEAARALGMEVVLWKSDQASHDALHSVLKSRYGLDIDFNVKERQ